MKIKEFEKLTFKEYKQNPIIAPPFPSPIIADPTFITPSESIDGRWHLFAHSLLGIHHFTAQDGIHYTRQSKAIIKNAMRPYILHHNNTYYLYYEKIKRFILWYSWLPHVWYSCIAMRSSVDCSAWSEEKIIYTPSLTWHGNSLGQSVSNPCVINHNNTFYLYYSAALAFIKDCGFNEPLYIGMAKADSPEGPFESLPNPIMEPSHNNTWNTIGCGSFKAFAVDDGFIGMQNGIYWDFQKNHSGSAIVLYSSRDGITFTQMRKEPIIKPDNLAGSFKRSHIYAFDARQVNSRQWYCYFNARSDWHWTKGKEHIGLLIAE